MHRAPNDSTAAQGVNMVHEIETQKQMIECAIWRQEAMRRTACVSDFFDSISLLANAGARTRSPAIAEQPHLRLQTLAWGTSLSPFFPACRSGLVSPRECHERLPGSCACARAKPA